MFNGIIYNQGIVTGLLKSNKSLLIEISTSIQFTKKEIGSSISCDGVCLTLTNIKKNKIFFYLSNETLKKSKFRVIKINDVVNLEKSIFYGQIISGHYVQGHIDTTGIVKDILIIDKSWVLKILIPVSQKKYLVTKASIAINGVSLTVSSIKKNIFEISVVPHTLKLTNLIKLKKLSLVNVEFDIFSKYLIKLNN